MSAPTRRKVLAGAAGIATAAVGAAVGRSVWEVRRQPEARVGTWRVESYDEAVLVDVIKRGIKTWPGVLAKVKGGVVVLKPNLVEVHEGRPINTDPRVIVAAAEAFRHHGAAKVIVAEGPGHHRDTELLLERTGLDHMLREVGVSFVDLNLDTTTTVALPRNLTGLGSLELGRTVVGCDLLVSMAKLKTHHWAGVTLTMKNLFGTVPGAVYGWPKNPLHWAGIERSILDLTMALEPGFGIIDGVVGMEGDGPIMGTPLPAQVLIMGDSVSAVDATGARLMGLVAERVPTLSAVARLGGTVDESRIRIEGDHIGPLPFALLPHFAYLRAT